MKNNKKNNKRGHNILVDFLNANLKLLLFLVMLAGGLLFANNLTAENKLHPAFVLRDLQGKPLVSSGQTMSPQSSCSNCHDSNWIMGHSAHNNEKVQVNCAQCHFENGKLPTNLKTAYKKITRPQNENCAPCHGIVYEGKELFVLPADYEKHVYQSGFDLPLLQTDKPETAYVFSQTSGSIFSSQLLSESGLNLQDKKDLNFSFDIHASAEVNCVHCHFTANSPGQEKNKASSLTYLSSDPRRDIRIQDYLQRPDHRLQTAACVDCHNPMEGHENLPRRKRHLQTNECQSCHVPLSYGPAFTAVDFTVSKKDGSPAVQYRGSSQQETENKPFSLLLQTGYKPFLSVKNQTNGSAAEKNEQKKLAPYNFVSWFYWQDQNGQEIPFQAIKKAMLKDGNYKAQILAVFDVDHDASLSNLELHLDSEEKIKTMKELLQQEGYANAQVQGRVQNYRLQHGVIAASFTRMDCSSCHGKNNRLQNDVFLSAYLPANVMPVLQTDIAQGHHLQKTAQGLLLKRQQNLNGLYVLGSSRVLWLSKLGFMLFLLSVTGVFAHGALRLFFARHYKSEHAKVKKTYMYTFYERLWHWTMATSILLLLLTGAEIHFTGTVSLFGLPNAVLIHNVLGFIVTINAFLSLFYHLTTGEISQYFNINRNFGKETISQVFFYVYGIFKGERHPVEKRTYRKTNPLQQMTYVVLLNIILPFQIISGLLIWGIEKSTSLNQMLGGLTYIVPLHSFASWVFLSFVVLHVYLTTTGHSVASNLQAMITGYDMVEEKDAEFNKQQKQLMKKGTKAMLQFYWTQFKDSFNRHILGKGGNKK